MQLLILDPNHPLRDEIETAVRRVFAAEFGAQLTSFPRTLAALLDDDGVVLSATGLRFESDGFFSEAYLDQPVEEFLSRQAGRPVGRNQIVEIGSMAGFKTATSLLLVDMVANRCLENGLSWAIFTATNRLRAMLRRSQIPTLDLAPACRDRMPNPDIWGNYYLHDPRVVAVHGAILPRFHRNAPIRAEASHA